MSCVAGHQPNLYPYGGFFAKIASVDQFVIVDNTQYVKKQYHNRNRIQLQDGTVKWLTIPIKNAGNYKQKINEVEIENSGNWARKHSKTLFLNYKKTPFFEQYFPQFDDLLAREWHLLIDFNLAVIRLCLNILEIDTPLFIASENNISGVATSLIQDICVKTNSDCYLHGRHARDYVDFNILSKAGIKNMIQDFHSLAYRQNGVTFVPDLSILDILFNCGDKTKKLILKSQNVDN